MAENNSNNEYKIQLGSKHETKCNHGSKTAGRQ